MSKTNLKSYDLRPLWDVILDIYSVFDSVCKKYNLRFCADSGTALGAVRHHGFIPWDDDFDIQMPRPDYEKFLTVISDELPPNLKWLDRFNCSCYEHGFGKIIVSDRSVVERVSAETGLPLSQGIFIDIFPLDGYPDSYFGRIWRKLFNRMLEFWPIMARIKCLLKFSKDIKLCKIQAHRTMVDIMDRRAKKYPFGSTKFCVSIGVSRWFDDKPYSYDFFGSPQKAPFDRMSIPLQENVDGYLTTIFGDYMTEPPIENQHPAHGGGESPLWRFGPL